MPYTNGKMLNPTRVAQALGGSNDTYSAVLHERVDASFSATAQPLLAYAFRSTLRAFVHTAYLNEGDSCIYTATVTGPSMQASTIVPGGKLVLNPGCLNRVDSTAVPATFAPHGTRLFPGRLGNSDENRGWWMDASCGMNITFDAASVGASHFTITVFSIQGKTWESIAESIIDAGHLNYSFNIAPAAPSYFSFLLTSTDPAPVGPVGAQALKYTMSLQVGRGVGTPQLTTYCHRTVAGISNNLADLTETRVVAATAMITNRAANIQLGGQVLGCPIPSGQSWQKYSFDYMSSSQYSFAENATKGVYGFIRPDGISSFDPVDEVVPADVSDLPLGGIPELSDACFLIIPRDEAIALAFLYPAPTSQSAFYTFAATLESVPTNPLFAAETCKLREGDVRHAINFASKLPQFYTNEEHEMNIFEKIWGGIKSFAADAANAVVSYGPAVMDAAKFLLPLLV